MSHIRWQRGKIPPLEDGTPCGAVYEEFAADRDILSRAVIKDRVPIGLVNRHEFFLHLSHLYGRSLYDKRPISVLMDSSPLIVDVNTPLQTLNDMIVTEKPGALLKGFIVTAHGHYLGVGTALSLLQLTSNHMNERARELEEARDHAEQASRAKSEFLANRSHELRTPLNAILGFSDIIRSEILGPLGCERYRDYAGDIALSGEHLLDLINDVLDVSKVEAGKMELHESVVSVEETIRRSLRMIDERADRDQVRIDCDLPQGLPAVQTDEHKLRQILVNILSNAVKFTPSAGRIAVSATAHTAIGLRITIADTGIGIDPSQISKVLEPFGQVEGGLRRKYNGTGLGLPLAKALAELHGGRLALSSEATRGTRVSILLPARRLVGAGALRSLSAA